MGYLARHIYHGHPDIETVHALDPARPPDVMSGTNKWSSRLLSGKMPHPELGYARNALGS
jgi:hypothetical protein